MGCGASRDAPKIATLTYIPRVQKERDDASLEPVQLKRLGVNAYDEFFADFEDAINNVVALHNKLFHSLCDVQAALAYATSPDPEYALEVEIRTEGVHSTPQLLLDVLYSDGNNRPLPMEIRHLLASRPVVAEADRVLADTVQDLAAAMQSCAASVRLEYDDSRQQLVAGGAGAAAVHHHVARVSLALAALRKAAPGLRVQVAVVPSAAPGANTFAWRLVPRSFHGDRAQASRQDSKSTAAAIQQVPVATPLRVASAHGAAAIVEAASTVAQQAAAVGAAVAGTIAAATAAAVAAATRPPHPSSSPSGSEPRLLCTSVATQLRTQCGRRLVAVPDSSQAAAIAAAAAAAVSATSPKAGIAAFRSLSLTRPSPPPVPVPVPAAAAGSVSGVNAAAQADEAAAVLRRALTGANHALFRLSKCAGAGASSGHDGAAMRSKEGAGFPIARAVKLVLDAAVQAARQVAVAAAVGGGAGAEVGVLESPRSDGGSACGGRGGCGFGESLPAYDLVSVDPRVTVASENGSVLSGSALGGAASSSSYVPLQAREGGAEGFTPGWSWIWDWGVQPRVNGVAFPECLPPKARTVYDAVNAAVAAAQSATDQLPLVQREVLAMVEEADVVFRKNEDKLAAAGGDMMTAGRMRAALDRNANTISASPALVGLLQAAVAKLVDELKRGAEDMRAVVHGDEPAESEAGDSSRPSGGRSAMAKQLQKAAVAAAASVAAAAAASATRTSGNGGSGRLSTQSSLRDSESTGDYSLAGAIAVGGGGGADVASEASALQKGARANDGRGGGGAADRGGTVRRTAPAADRAPPGGVIRRVMLPPLPHGCSSYSPGVSRAASAADAVAGSGSSYRGRG